MKTYIEIENWDRTKNVDYFVNKYPELLTSIYVIQEKMHGVNIFLHFDANGKMTIGRRGGKLKEDEDYYGIRKLVIGMGDFTKEAVDCVLQTGKTLTFYGELFGMSNGEKIQKKIVYGHQTYLLFYDFAIDDELQAPIEFYWWMTQHGVGNYLIPTIAKVDGLENALKFNETFVTTFKFAPKTEDNIAEGIVIKPFEKIYRLESGDVFYVKKKPAKFRERQEEKQEKGKKTNVFNPLAEYVNENRVDAVLSKYEEFRFPQQIGKFANLVYEDAAKDATKDGITNASEFRSPTVGLAAKLLKKRLEGEG